MKQFNRYGQNEWKRKLLNILIAILLIGILGFVGRGAYVVLWPKYEAYKEAKAVKEEQERKEQEKLEKEAERVKQEEEAAAKKTAEEEEARKAQEEAEAEEARRAEEEQKLKADYILPYSDRMYLTDSDVQNLSLQEINYAKNEIYARHGRKFQSVELQNYFNSKSWYQGTIEANAFSTSVFNQYEIANAEFLANKEFSMDSRGYQLDKQ